MHETKQRWKLIKDIKQNIERIRSSNLTHFIVLSGTYLDPWQTILIGQIVNGFQSFVLLYFNAFQLCSIFGISSILQHLLCKIPQFYLISCCGNFVERCSFRRASGKSSKTLQKLRLSKKFLLEEIRWNCGILHRDYRVFQEHWSIGERRHEKV